MSMTRPQPKTTKKLLGISLPILVISQLLACSTYDAVRVVTSGNPGNAIENIARSRVNSYKTNPLRLASDMQRLVKLLSGEVDREWGRQERILPSAHRYVKYTQNYKSRAIIDFDTGWIRVESLDRQHPVGSLRNAIVTTLLTPDDPRAVDLYSARTIKLSGRPYLYGLVQSQHGQYIDTPARAEGFATHLLATSRSERVTQTPEGAKTVHTVRFRMLNDHENLRARRYASLVEHYARRFAISRSLVYAIIKTESNFNPYAVSHAPAYGLMQLVPASGGRDAFRLARGQDRIPSADFLFNPRNNIELGTAYLNVLNYRYLKDIANPLSREYCIIAAYNTGAGNVLRTFSADREQAKRIINSMPPDKLYRHLRRHLQAAEARRYLAKVTEARRQFVSL
ncbi:MAG: murein transglycosylase domain-containing protein [Sulfuriflexus sp.]|nr:murein transglycosylase domain-containing protein [Sulfuriflexus sp.]